MDKKDEMEMRDGIHHKSNLSLTLLLVHASVHAISDANNEQGTVTVTLHTWNRSHIKADSVQ